MVKREERLRLEKVLDQMEKELHETNFIIHWYTKKFHSLEIQRIELSETIAKIRQKLDKLDNDVEDE